MPGNVRITKSMFSGKGALRVTRTMTAPSDSTTSESGASRLMVTSVGRKGLKLKGHDHNVSAYSRRSVNAWGVVNFASTVCTYYPGQSTFPC